MKIAVLCMPGIGDALMATPTITFLKKKFPDAQIDIFCMFAGVKYIFDNNVDIQNVYKISLYKENKFVGLSQLLKLRKNNYDISILTFPAYRKEYHLVHWLVGAKKRIAHTFGKGYWSEWNFLDTDRVLISENVHNVINNMNLLSALQIDWRKEIKPESFGYSLQLRKDDKTFADTFFKSIGWNKKDVIAIHPGSTASKAGKFRRWSIDRYQNLISKLIKEYKKNIVIFIGPDEKEVGLELFKKVGDEKHCQLIDNLPFGQAIGILSEVSLLIANDNGFGHIANAFHVPSIVLYGSTNPVLSAPYNKKYVSIIRKATFEPWFRNYVKADKPPVGAKSGMEEITVKDVLSKAEKDFGIHK